MNRFLEYCIRGLEKGFVPSENIFAACRVFVNGEMTLKRDHDMDFLVTMNALMGLNEARTQGYKVFLDIESVYFTQLKRIEEMKNNALGVIAAVWTGRCMGVEIPSEAKSIFDGYIERAPQMTGLPSKCLAWMIIASLAGDTVPEENAASALKLAKLAEEKYINSGSDLVHLYPRGLRRNWASFGEHSFMAYAFLLLSRKLDNKWAKGIGLKIVKKLVQLQGPDGQWGWMYHVPSGRIGDFYPVYSVHQYGYAPFMLLEAMDLGYNEFREPLLKSFRWILGNNELSQSMVDPQYQIIWRRVIRTGANSRLVKMLRGMAVAYTGLKPDIGKGIQVEQQCRSFEMALPLYLFSSRHDFDEIMNDSQFAAQV